MLESSLHQLFLSRKLGNQFATSANETLEVIDFGIYNTNAGPDFLQAIISINGIIWAGHIEFHIKSSDWYRHRHQLDPAYQNVIAHFVYDMDCEVRSGDFLLPTIELKPLLKGRKLPDIQHATRPCEKSLGSVGNEIIRHQIRRSFQMRLTRKSDVILSDIHRLRGDINKALYVSFARVFGGKVNAPAFERLVSLVDLNKMRRWAGSPEKFENILLGAAGLLHCDKKAQTSRAALQEYLCYKSMCGQQEMNSSEWRYSRMHPGNFPDKKIRQFSTLFRTGISPESLVQNIDTAKVLQDFFATSGLSPDLIRLLLINTVIPFVYAMGVYSGRPALCSSASERLSDIAAEKNRVIRSWEKSGIKPLTALESQGLLELATVYCNHKKCLLCNIGKSILKK